MSAAMRHDGVRWYRSFYFRIAISFVLFSVCLLILQGLLIGVRTRSQMRDRSPNRLVAIVAADVSAMLSLDVSSDLDGYLKSEYSQLQPIYVVMKNGGTVSNRSAPLAQDIWRYVDDMLDPGTRPPQVEPRVAVPFVTAPVHVSGALHGIVVLPPAPEPDGIVRDVERFASVRGTLLLVALTVVAAAFVFEPARRRLQALEAASQRLGEGDLSARAETGGGDEIARLAAAFNRMAGELASRDEALRTSDRLRRQMLADVSHELKTPLTAMRGYVETLRAQDIQLDPATRTRYFAVLEQETIRLDRIVKDLTDLSRLEHGVAELERRVFAVARIFEHVLRRHQRDIERRRIAVRVTVSPAADQIVADPDRLEQVIENLVANALRHTPDRGAVELSASIQDGHVVLTVSDSGEGIPAEHLPHVFDRFYKVDSARANLSGGSGLGLPIAKAIVERHQGTIAVTSSPGRTVFTIVLPGECAIVG